MGVLPVCLSSVVSPDVESCSGVKRGVKIFVLVSFDMLSVNFDWEPFHFAADIPDKIKVWGRAFRVPCLGDCQHCPFSI